jgi:ribosomal protein L24
VSMHIKKGDTVQASPWGCVARVDRPRVILLAAASSHHALLRQVIAGKDKGVVGLIKEVLSTKGECVVEGVNIKVRD